VTKSAIDYVKREFEAIPLVERAILKLANHSGIRIQIGRFPRIYSPSSLLFVAGFWCEGEGKARDGECEREEETRTEAYAIPKQAEDNFNGLSLDDLLFDYRVSIADIEKTTSLLLLPQSMDVEKKNR
ncbi:hypothetical protein PMAYCL1PPCAC_01259, partial [Pristionchus mayeri]